MEVFEGIKISLWITLPLLVFCAWIAAQGRVDFLLGIYLACVWQSPPGLDFPVIGLVSTTWVLLPILLFSVAVYITKHRLPAISRSDGKLIFWLTAWVTWIFILLLAVPITNVSIKVLGEILVLKFAFPLLLLAIAVSEPKNLRTMAISFILTTLAMIPQTVLTLTGIGGSSLFVLTTQPWWKANRVVWFNYHDIGQVAAMSILFTIALLADPVVRQRWYSRALYLTLMVLVFYLIWSSSRQYIIGILIIVPVFLLWLGRGRARQRPMVFLTIFIVGSLFLLMYRYVPEFFRFNTLGMDPSDSSFLARRPLIYSEALSWFYHSPIWGNGILNDATRSHNLFLDALVSQGILGLVFLGGFFFLILPRARGTWQGEVSHSLDIWRMTALLLLGLGILQSQVSGGVLTANLIYLGSIMIWRLYVTWHRVGATSISASLIITTHVDQRNKSMSSPFLWLEQAKSRTANRIGKKTIE